MDQDILNDRSLRFQGNGEDREVFESLAKKAYPRIFRAAWCLTRNDADAEDMAQETLMKAFRARHSFNGDAAPLTWLCAIAMNALQDKRRRSKVRHEKLTTSIDDPAHYHKSAGEGMVPRQFVVEARQSRVMQADYVARLLEKISQQERALLVLKEVEGHSLEEISQISGLGANTVKTKLFRARKKLMKASAREALKEAAKKISNSRTTDLHIVPPTLPQVSRLSAPLRHAVA